jgi:two-component system sensor kinase FixL
VNAVGQLSAALAHELNQPLTAAATYLGASRRMLETGAPPADKLREAIDKAAAQITRTGQIVGRLRAFIEKGETKRAPYDLNAIVEEVVTFGMIGAKLGSVQLAFALTRPLPAVFIDRIQVQQVLVNLARNAVEAMTGDRRVLVLGTRQIDDKFVEAWVGDTGPGLPATVAERLFQPFVSTKRNGMGIGLSICRSIIEAHRGELRAEPNPGGGTVFRFSLPLAPTGESPV